MRDESFVYADGIQGVAKAIPYQAEHWLSLLDQGSTVTVTIPNANTSQVYLEELENNISGGYVAGELSSWGPSWELSMTPQLMSPGENILSTYPTAMGSYRVMTGTSMGIFFVSYVKKYWLKLTSNSASIRRLRTAWRSVRQAGPEALAPNLDFNF
jgi:hypothetical protein